MREFVPMLRRSLKNMTRISLFLMALISLEGNPMDREYYQLTLEQKQLLKMAYEYWKEYDLGYTLAAIAWQESFIGNKIIPIT